MPSYLVVAPLVIAKDAAGKLRHCYTGAVIPWLEADTAAYLLRIKMIEEFVGQTTPTAPAPTIPTYGDREYVTPEGGEQVGYLSAGEPPTPRDFAEESYSQPLRPRALPRKQTLPTPTSKDTDNVATPTPVDHRGENWLDRVTRSRRVEECIDALTQLDLPPDIGAFVARRALRAAGHRFSNSVISEAVKLRKALLPETAQVR
jgi:hypothetical protein